MFNEKQGQIKTEGRIEDETRGSQLEKALVESAINGAADRYDFKKDDIIKYLSIIATGNTQPTEEILQKILTGIDKSAERIGSQKSKTDIIILNKKISAKYGSSQLGSPEPTGFYKIFKNVFEKRLSSLKSEIEKIEDEKEKEQLQNLSSAMENIKDLKKLYALSGKELESAFQEKYSKRWDTYIKKGFARGIQKNFKQIGYQPENKEQYLEGMKRIIIGSVNKAAEEIKDSDPQLKLKFPEEISQKSEEDPKNELLTAVNINIKTRKKLASYEELLSDQKNIQSAVDILSTQVPSFKKEFMYDMMTGFYSASEDKYKAEYFLYIDDRVNTLIFQKIQNSNDCMSVLSKIGYSFRVSQKARANMSKAAAIRVDIGQALQENKKSFKEYLKEYIHYSLEEELDNQQKLVSHINDRLSDIVEPEKGIISVTKSNKSEMAIVVRCSDKESIPAARKAVKSAIKDSGISLLDRIIAKYDPSIETTVASYSDDSGRVYIVFKYDTGSREGLALEHIVAMLLTRKITSELKNRLDLPEDATKEDVKAKLKNEYADVLQVALKGKKMVEDKVGNIQIAESEGSRNSKADLILTNDQGVKYGLSIKLVTEEGREVRFTYNKNLGYGDEQEDNIVKNPSGKPWWLVGRQIFADKLGRSYSADSENLETPSWMEKAKEDKPDVYKETMEEVYEQLRGVFVNNLRKMKLKELVEMVNEAHLGESNERERYEKLLVLSSDVDGINLKEVGYEQPDLEKIKMDGMDKSDIVKMDGAKIIIDIPGMSSLTIHGLKFHSNMLSSNREDLKIKTR